MPPARGKLPRKGAIELRYRRQGLQVAGVDEVGRGCLAGPVYAGCALLDWQRLAKLPRETRQLIRDSKQLSPSQRARMVPVIKSVSLACATNHASVDEINELGIVAACFLAMRRAITSTRAHFDVLLVDGKWPIPDHDGCQVPVIKGDALCFSIAAASILAKEARDVTMRRFSSMYPEYGFDRHVGYGTKHHLAMIRSHGACTLHRTSFEPIREIQAKTRPNLAISCNQHGESIPDTGSSL